MRLEKFPHVLTLPLGKHDRGESFSTGCKTCRLRFAHVDAFYLQVLGGESAASALQYDNHFPRSLEVAALLMAHGGGTSGSSEHWLLVPVTQPRVMCSVLKAIRDGLNLAFAMASLHLMKNGLKRRFRFSPYVVIGLVCPS